MAMMMLRQNDFEQMITIGYDYTGAPASHPGSHTKMVLNTCERTLKYNKGKNAGKRMKATKPFEELKREIDVPQSQTDKEAIAGMYKRFYDKHKTGCQEALMKWMERMNYTKFSDLSKGRQTYDFTTDSNQPASVAFKNAHDCLEMTYGKPFYDSHRDAIEVLATIMDGKIPRDKVYFYKNELLNTKQKELNSERRAFNKERQRFFGKTVEYNSDRELESSTDTSEDEDAKKARMEWFLKREKYSKSKKALRQNEKVRRRKVSMPWKEWIKRLNTMSTFPKNLERGKLEGRSIASGGIFFRLVTTQGEVFTEELCKVIDESAIRLGRIEKERSIEETLTFIHREVMMTVTGDLTKYNEMNDMYSVGIGLNVICQNACRDLGFYDEMKNIERFWKLYVWFFIEKRLKMGPGLAVMNKSGMRSRVTGRDMIKVIKDEFPHCSAQYDPESNTIKVEPGMVMGMANIATTLHNIVVSSDFREKSLGRQLRSSDDFIMIVGGHSLRQCIINMYYKMFLDSYGGFVWSTSKSFGITGSKYCEYNSLHKMGRFNGNVATTLPNFLPMGKNPVDDWTMLTKSIIETIHQGNLDTAVVPLVISIVERLYRISYSMFEDEEAKAKSVEDRPFMRKYVLQDIPNEYKMAIYNGGPNLNSTTTMHLDPIAIGLIQGEETMSKDYILRVMNPRNPFNCMEEDKELVMFEASKKMMYEDDMSSCSMKFKWKENRTRLQSAGGRAMIITSREYASAMNLIEKIDKEMTVLQVLHDFSIEKKLAGKLLFEGSKLQEEMTEEDTVRIKKLEEIVNN